MLEKKPALIITFSTTTEAMAMEKFCMENNLPGRIIPVPREITAGCGLSWKAPMEEMENLTNAMQSAGLCWTELRIIEI